MKNLTVQQVHRRSPIFMGDYLENSEKLFKRRYCVTNQSHNEMYFLLGELLFVIPFGKKDIDILDFSFPSEITDFSKMIAMEYCITLQELYCAFESGYILKADIKNRSRIDYDIVATFDKGLQCMKFSPDNELIVVVTGTGNVITMVLDFQVMSKVDLYSEEFGENKFVDVGWGKKETQFHGSMGKAAAREKPELTPNEHDDGRIQIAWHENGALFAVSFLHRKTKIRKFKIFNREGVLCSTSEKLNGLEQYMTWSALENLLAVSQILNDKYIIVLVEKSGLKYTEFLLPFTPQEIRVKNLLWSLDVLAIVCHCLETNNTLIQLWIENNSQWYLKHTLVFPVETPLLYVTWSDVKDVSDKRQLLYLTTKELAFYSFNRCLNQSRGKTLDDKVVCGVINGNKILVTAFKDGVMPPPMAHQTLKTSELQNAIIFAPNINNESSLINSNEFCTLSCNNKFTFFKLMKKSCTLTYKVANTCSIVFDKLRDVGYEEFEEVHRYKLHNFLWLTEDIMLCSINTEKYYLFCVLSLDEVHLKNHLRIQKVHLLDFPVEHIISSPDANAAYVKVSERIFKYTLDGKFEQINILLKEKCLQMEVIKLGSKEIILALSNKDFLINGKEIANNITSFYVHSDFLLLTTLQHTLICVSLTDAGIKQLTKHDLTVKPWLNDMNVLFTDIYIRRIERYSIIIAAIPYDSKIILQMPRGNLECIQPRVVSLHLIKRYLNNCDYFTALNIMTKERINLNLIYDHNPQLFLDNVEKFVEDIVQHKKLNWLNVFLIELREEDVTNIMYVYSYTENHIIGANVKSTVKGKVNKICKLLRDVMEKRQDADNLIQPILISLVKNEQTQEMENALNKIKQMKMLEDSRKLAARDPTSSVSVHEALKFLLHFVSIDMLYDVALGMYDLELAMFIASKSSKDPKEYVSFLNNLKELDQNYMKYTIDVHLKRYELALEHLSEDQEKFEECLDFIRSQKLHKTAMKLFKKNTTEYRKVAEVYAEFLLSEKKYPEAGMMFYKSGDLDKALKTFNMSCDNWEDVITIAKEMKLSPANLCEIYKTLVERLKVEQKYENAAVILREYLNDIEEAVALLCEARLWKYALRIVVDAQRLDLNETHIKPGVKGHAEHVISQLDTMKEDFLGYKSRLDIVRTAIETKRFLHENTCIREDELEFNEILDSISDLSFVNSTSSRTSQMSTSSSKSYRSSKNRRKQERKLFSLKEGSMFEDLSLIYALYQIVNNAYKDRDEWYQLVEMLIRFEFDESAEKISVKARELLQLVENSKSEIWDRLAPTSLSNLEKNNSGNYTQSQFQEIIAPIKLIERYVMYPPEADARSRELFIF